MYTYIYICICICMYIYTYIHIHIHIYMCIYIYRYMNTHIYIYTHVYIYIYIYTHTVIMMFVVWTYSWWTCSQIASGRIAPADWDFSEHWRMQNTLEIKQRANMLQALFVCVSSTLKQESSISRKLSCVLFQCWNKNPRCLASSLVVYFTVDMTIRNILQAMLLVYFSEHWRLL